MNARNSFCRPARLSRLCKNLRSAYLIVRISGRFFGPLISASELNFFCDARDATSVSLVTWTTRRGALTRRKTQRSMQRRDFRTRFSARAGWIEIIDGNCVVWEARANAVSSCGTWTRVCGCGGWFGIRVPLSGFVCSPLLSPPMFLHSEWIKELFLNLYFI